MENVETLHSLQNLVILSVEIIKKTVQDFLFKMHAFNAILHRNVTLITNIKVFQHFLWHYRRLFKQLN